DARRHARAGTAPPPVRDAAEPADAGGPASRRGRRAARLPGVSVPDGGQLAPLSRAPTLQLVRLLLGVRLSDPGARERRGLVPPPGAACRGAPALALLRPP